MMMLSSKRHRHICDHVENQGYKHLASPYQGRMDGVLIVYHRLRLFCILSIFLEGRGIIFFGHTSNDTEVSEAHSEVSAEALVALLRHWMLLQHMSGNGKIFWHENHH